MAIDPNAVQLWLAQLQMQMQQQQAQQSSRDRRGELNLLQQLLSQSGDKDRAANQANEARYNDILELLGLNRRDQIGMVDQYGQSLRDDTNRKFDVAQRNALSDLSSRGLSGSTIRASVQTRNARERNAALNRLEDQLLQNRMDVRDRTLNPITGVMERRTDAGPNLNAINALAGQLGVSGIGSGLGGGLGGGLATAVSGGGPSGNAFYGGAARNAPSGGSRYGTGGGGEPPIPSRSGSPRPISGGFRGVQRSMPSLPSWLFTPDATVPALTGQQQRYLQEQQPSWLQQAAALGANINQSSPYELVFGNDPTKGPLIPGQDYQKIRGWQSIFRGNNAVPGVAQMAAPYFPPFPTTPYYNLPPAPPATTRPRNGVTTPRPVSGRRTPRPIAATPIGGPFVAPPSYSQPSRYAWA